MEIFAQGKNIPTYAFGQLFVKGENCADKITFIVDRYYCGNDLSQCDFSVIGVTENGCGCFQALVPAADGDRLRLDWTVSSDFTSCSGKLELELRASMDDRLILKYDMPPVMVKDTLTGGAAPVPDISEQIVSDINAAASAALAQIDAKTAGFDIEGTRARLDQMEADTAVYLARPEVVALTAEQYAATAPKTGSLYVIIKE